MEKLIAIFVLVTTIGLLNFNRPNVIEEETDIKSGEATESNTESGKVAEEEKQQNNKEESQEGTFLANDFELMKYMPQDKNYMISPFSLRMAMMLAANGADGQTKSEILKAFNISDIDEFNNKAKEIINRYNTNEFVKLNIANSIWLNTTVAGNDVKFSKAYEDLIAKYYDGVSIEEDSQKIAFRANKWIAEKTNNKIKNVLAENGGADFLSLLINTIYFKGEWINKFEEYNTRKDVFTDKNSKENSIDFMNQTTKFNYYEDNNMKMVKLPYKGGELSMYIVLPQNRDAMDINNAINNMQEFKVRLKIPKFKMEYETSFTKTLNGLGVNTAFNGALANFKKMFDNNSINNTYIDDVIQKSFIEVNEDGTEAAAATVIMIKNTAVFSDEPEIIKEFYADKPFIYFILDENTKEVLFLGEYAYVD